jgi:hypothetical protein
MTLRLHLVVALMRSARPYSLYVLVVLMVVYLVNQLDRFVLGIAGKSLAGDLHFGSLGCYLDPTNVSTSSCDYANCNATREDE